MTNEQFKVLTGIATIIAAIPVLIASLTWIVEGNIRKEQRITELWRTLYQTGGDAQKKALLKLRNEHQINNFYGLKMSKANLDNFDFSSSNLRSADLSYTSLKDANFENANLCGVDLTGTNLIGANLKGTLLIKANMTETILVNAEINNNTNFTKANASGANFQDVRGMTIEKVIQLFLYDDNTTFPEHLRQHEPLRTTPSIADSVMSRNSNLSPEEISLCSWKSQ